MRHVEVANGVHVAVTKGDARTLLRDLLTTVAGDIPVANAPTGQPVLPDLSVSLSRSEGWAAAAVAFDAKVGVDIQVPQPASDGVLRKCCSPATCTRLSRLRNRDLAFAWIWTAQEACVKATGQGFGGLPWRIPVEIGQLSGSWRGVEWQALWGFGVPVSWAVTR